MANIMTIPAERLRGLDVHEGDTLRVLAAKESSFLVEIIRRTDACTTPPGKAGAWLLSARGSVLQATGKSADELRMSYYAAKYGLSQ